MNKLLLLPHIKCLVFVLMYLTKYFKFLIYSQKTCLNGLNTSICFTNYQAIVFFYSQERKFSTDQDIFQSHQNFCNQRNFRKSWKFSTVMKMSNKQESFPQKKSYLIKKVFRKKVFSLIIEIFHKGRKFPQTRLFLDQEYFPEAKPFIKSKKFSANKF